ncbi:hypothetical protein AYI68_g7920, partial [Smittium mucronatum]
MSPTVIPEENKNIRMLLSDVFLRRFVVRHLLCYILLTVHKSFTLPENLPSSSPELVLFDYKQVGLDSKILSVIEEFGVTSKFNLLGLKEENFDSENKEDEVQPDELVQEAEANKEGGDVVSPAKSEENAGDELERKEKEEGEEENGGVEKVSSPIVEDISDVVVPLPKAPLPPALSGNESVNED